MSRRLYDVQDITPNIYLLKVNNKNTRKRPGICSKLAIKTPERWQQRRSGVFIVNFEQISHVFFNVPMVDVEQVFVCWDIFDTLSLHRSGYASFTAILKNFVKLTRKCLRWSTSLIVLVLQPAALWKKKLRHRYFPENIAKLFRTTFCQTTVVDHCCSLPNRQRGLIFQFGKLYQYLVVLSSSNCCTIQRRGVIRIPRKVCYGELCNNH